MLVSYILVIGKMDVEIVVVLRKKPTMQPKETLKDLDKMQNRRIMEDNWSMAYQQRDKTSLNIQRCCFCLPNKHPYSTSCLDYVLRLAKACKENDVADKKCFAYMIKWYITVRNTLLGLMTKLFKV
ncbi:unnamed protein product [Lactuca saligna]|uniref:Uncharacterized protein n=1 Tax=Lactuca saligna TaxID=75948 RepID=A0AA36EGX1_LACSI|nr:unnamed protein product [Lactuca saligna]